MVRALRRAVPAALAGILLTVLIAVAGSLLGPSWQPRPYEPVPPATADTSVPSSRPLPSVGTYPTTTERAPLELAPGVEVTVRTTAPVGAPGPVPAVVFLHGAGSHTSEGFAEQARDLASAGIVAVVPDKRMDTYSTAHRDYVASAADYHRSIEVAASLPGVDPDRIGIYAESEGAYIAPVLAAEYEEVDFVVLVSAPVVPPRQQAAYAVHTYLEATGVPPALFRLIPRAFGGEFPFGVLGYADFDPQPYQQRLTQPLLVVYGTADNSMPHAQGAAQLIGDAAVAGNQEVTVRFYAGANHGIRHGSITDPLVPGFTEDLSRWINGLPGTAQAEPQVAGDLPNQHIWAEAPPRPIALLSGDLLVVSHVLPPLTLLIGAVLGMVAMVRSARLGRLRREVDVSGKVSSAVGGRRHNRLIPVYLAAAAVLAAATWYVWINYVLDIAGLATTYQQDHAISFGGYEAENQVAGAAAFALGVALFAWYRQVRLGARYGLLARTAAAAVAAGTLGLLLLASYWSGFPTLGWAG